MKHCRKLHPHTGSPPAPAAATTATATTTGGAVTVTLSPTGALQGISFSAKASAHKPEALGPLVTRTVQDAQRPASARVDAARARLDDHEEPAGA
ncbi:MAG: hypothetical protein GEV28_18015 [Actinophytocola sp.]|uniref:YbaB/EbfC family nucleoid-associated protein n=1 Tax=Actinophytocola sp. TaxID=1872138 RepID=UPI00132AEC87|nr:hypothetical protein [Actinophytocola sp.]